MINNRENLSIGCDAISAQMYTSKHVLQVLWTGQDKGFFPQFHNNVASNDILALTATPWQVRDYFVYSQSVSHPSSLFISNPKYLSKLRMLFAYYRVFVKYPAETKYNVIPQ